MMRARIGSTRLFLTLAMVAALAAAAVSCSSRSNTASNDTSNPNGTPNDQTAGNTNHPNNANGQMSNNMTDPEIAAVVIAVNDADIKNGQLAEHQARDGQVKSFAKQMVTDHEAVNKKTKDLTSKLNISPTDNQTTQQLKQSTDQERDQLKQMKGTDFDKAYIDNEVQMHQQALDMIDKNLEPNAQNDELKQLLKDSRPAFAAHLEHAKRLQAQMQKGGTTGNSGGGGGSR